jgi:enterochelin esterase family protein
MNLIKVLLISLLGATLCDAQSASQPEAGVAASTNVAGADYPRILPDLRVVFQIKAPGAQKVQFDLGKRYLARKSADGTWPATTNPQVPGFHYYWLVIDGMPLNDPASETFFGVGRETSGIDIPEPGVDFYNTKDVPHGEVREHWYFSKTTEDWRRIFVYTPPGYDTSGDTRYPVLYLQHGAGEDERGWSNQGHVAQIIDNLIAEKKAKPMLIVMEQGYAWLPGEPHTAFKPSAARAAVAGASVSPSATPAASATPRPINRMANTFEKVMINDLIPMIDATYRTIPDREHRAMAGLSMGGAETFQITLDHLDLFDYIGGFSGAGGGFGGAPVDLKTAHDGIMADADAFNKKVRLVWIGLGTAEPKNIYNAVFNYHQALTAAGIKHQFYISLGTAHEWQTWRRDLKEFAPLLFQ